MKAYISKIGKKQKVKEAEDGEALRSPRVVLLRAPRAPALCILEFLLLWKPCCPTASIKCRPHARHAAPCFYLLPFSSTSYFL